MGKFLLIFISFFSFSAFAMKAPPSFISNGKKAIFIDIDNAHYHIDYNITTKITTVKTSITFMTEEAGYPLFDIVVDPTSASLNGDSVQTELIRSPDSKTSYRMINKEVSAGLHSLQLTTPLINGTKYETAGVRSGFFMSDLDDRQFLERYLPSNLEYDQFTIMFHIKYIGATTEHDIFTNGLLSNNGTEWIINFPSEYNTSSVYFHTAPKGAFEIKRETFTSIDGRTIPVTVYGGTTSLIDYVVKARSTFIELERDYGPWLHNSLTIYAGPIDGGMEYAGATITNLRALSHEMTHSYFARGFMPANGDSGWMDEAIASWRDIGYPRLSTLTSEGTNMGNRSAYARTTAMSAYSTGADFMAHLDFLSANNGGLKKFLAGLVKEHAFEPLFTQEFQGELETFNKTSLQSQFNKIIYGGAGKVEKSEAVNPYHPRLTAKQLDQLL